MNKDKRTFGGVFIAAFLTVVAALAAPSGVAAETSEQQILVDKALITFQEFMMDENMAWIRENLPKSKGVIIIPSLLKGGFILGGSGGNGVLLVRDEKTGQWSQPGFYTVGSVTFGLQIGGEAAQVIMVVRSQGALDSLYSSSVKLGGDTSISAGPVGAGAKGAVTANIVSFGKSKGAYAGLNLEGAVLDVRDSWNEAYYGKPVRPTDIFVTKSVSNSGSAELRKALAKADRGERMQPAKTTKSGGESYHVVQSGDTLWGISQEYGVSVAELRRLNDLDEGQNIYPGQKLTVK
jgi:lipid-binding SYLF domain-containing protein